MTGRREDRRWSRERHDEAARWGRERLERQQQRDREDADRWQHDRLALYSKLLLDLDSWRRVARDRRRRLALRKLYLACASKARNRCVERQKHIDRLRGYRDFVVHLVNHTNRVPD